MNRSDIVDSVAEVLDSKVQARTAVDAVIKAISKGLAEDGRVHITGIGSFTSTQVPSRMVRNPSTGKKVRAKKTARVRFRPAPDLKEFLVGRKKIAGIKVKATTKG